MSEEPVIFPSKEIMLKLYRDLKDAGSMVQIAAFKDYLNSVKEEVDAQKIEIKLNQQVGFIHFQHEEYSDAIRHLEKVYNLVSVAGDPSEYFFNLTLLIDAHRHCRNYGNAFAWFDIAVANIKLAPSPFDKLSIITRYVDLLHAAGQPFNHSYNVIVEEIAIALGLPDVKWHSITDRVKTIQALNKQWNRRLGTLTLSKLKNNDLIKAYEAYKEECEIGWYREYAQRVIDKLKAANNTY
jgi:hypothetical protein